MFGDAADAGRAVCHPVHQRIAVYEPVGAVLVEQWVLAEFRGEEAAKLMRAAGDRAGGGEGEGGGAEDHIIRLET